VGSDTNVPSILIFVLIFLSFEVIVILFILLNFKFLIFFVASEYFSSISFEEVVLCEIPQAEIPIAKENVKNNKRIF